MRRLIAVMVVFTFVLCGASAQQARGALSQNLSTSSTPPSLWFESGLAYRAGEDGLTPHLRVGVRGVQPLTDTAAIYAAFALDGDLLLDVGGWYSFLPGADDLFGFRSYAGTGLTYVAGSFGVALSAAVSYEVSAQTALIVVYTHRPLLLPALGQAFDVSFGVRIIPPR